VEPSYARKAEGVAIITAPLGGIFEQKTTTCGHCQKICFVEAGTDGTGGVAEPIPGLEMRERRGTDVCHICWRIVCGPCHKLGVCTPWEERMIKIENRDRFLRSAGII
jgi:hypothetical protein